jgi:hypothetical protein
MDSFQCRALRHKILSGMLSYVRQAYDHVCRDLVHDKILSGMLSYVRQAYDHVRRDLVSDKILLMLDNPTF